jgi:hypothetical protein
MATHEEDERLDPYAAAASTTAGGLFYSTRTDWATAATHRQHQPAAGGGGRGAISLVESAHESHPDAASRDALSLSLDDDDDDDDHHLLDNAPRTGKGAQVQGAGSSSIVAALPAFVSRVAGAGGGGRGWKAYESIAASSRAGAGGALSRHVVYSDDEDDDDDDEEDDEPVPGAFVSPQPTTSTSAKPKGTPANIAPAPTTTLHVYPVPGPNGYNEPHGEDRYYRDSIWIVLYGMSLLAVVALALQAFWTSPPPSPPPSSSRDPSTSLFLSALPTLSLLGAISAIAGIASLAYLLTIPYALPLLLRFAIYGGPALLFVVTGIVAFAGSYGLGGGVASDRGWKVGVRWLAAGCFVMGFGLFRSAVARRKELNRAISVGQVRTVSLSSRTTRGVLISVHGNRFAAHTARVPNRPRAPVPDRPRHLALAPLGHPHPPFPLPHRDPPLLLPFVPENRQLGYRLDRVGVLVDVGDREGVVACGGGGLYWDLVL